MPDVILKLKPSQMEEMIKSLDENEKLRILKLLEDITWRRRFDNLTKRLRAKTKNISMKDITREVEAVRKELYESRR